MQIITLCKIRRGVFVCVCGGGVGGGGGGGGGWGGGGAPFKSEKKNNQKFVPILNHEVSIVTRIPNLK